MVKSKTLGLDKISKLRKNERNTHQDFMTLPHKECQDYEIRSKCSRPKILKVPLVTLSSSQCTVDILISGSISTRYSSWAKWSTVQGVIGQIISN